MNFLAWALTNYSKSQAHTSALTVGYRLYRRALKKARHPRQFIVHDAVVTLGKKKILCSCQDYNHPIAPDIESYPRPRQPFCKHTAAIWFMLWEPRFDGPGKAGQFRFCNRCRSFQPASEPGWKVWPSGKRRCPTCGGKK